jgi:hypothetical protein
MEYCEKCQSWLCHNYIYNIWQTGIADEWIWSGKVELLNGHENERKQVGSGQWELYGLEY